MFQLTWSDINETTGILNTVGWYETEAAVRAAKAANPLAFYALYPPGPSGDPRVYRMWSFTSSGVVELT
jgi:hypothetical protein